jgi:2-succinyl-5-enolpyruvyl-6-hydroxy-3-cyclohexene-1-carboxylate synthase
VNPSTLCARTLVRALLSAGVRDVVLSPGSRSAPLVYAWADAEAALASSAHPLRLHVRIDERDAAFTALGLAKAGRLRGRHRPVAVVTTSGSAVGNLHPAVMEAAHQHLPLILLTADRPARLRGTGANQTLDAQHASLPEAVAAWDLSVPESADEAAATAQDWATAAEAAVARACTSPVGPVQVNAQFDAPLVPDEAAGAFEPELSEEENRAVSGSAGERGAADELRDRVRAILHDPESRPVIVAGDDLGFATQTLRALAEENATPILAEPSSALAASPRTIPAHAQVLGAPESEELRADITHVIVTGRPTLSRPVAGLLARPDVERIELPYDADGLVDQLGRAVQRSDERSSTVGAAPESGVPRASWWDRWSAAAEEAAAAPAPPSTVDAAVLALLEEPGVLVAASSNTVRLLARLQRPHHPARVVASRGLAGIDGLVATASGGALGLEGEAGSAAASDGKPVRLLIGDLAALHDLGGLVVPAHEQRPHLQIIVLNDDGGAIFAGLEHSQPHVADRFDRFFATPHGLDLAAAAAALGTEAQSIDAGDIDTPATVRAFLQSGRPGLLQLRLPPVRG